MTAKLYTTTLAVSAVAALILSLDAQAQTTTPMDSTKPAATASAPAGTLNNRQGENAKRPGMNDSRADKKMKSGKDHDKMGHGSMSNKGGASAPMQGEANQERDGQNKGAANPASKTKP